MNNEHSDNLKPALQKLQAGEGEKLPRPLLYYLQALCDFCEEVNVFSEAGNAPAVRTSDVFVPPPVKAEVSCVVSDSQFESLTLYGLRRNHKFDLLKSETCLADRIHNKVFNYGLTESLAEIPRSALRMPYWYPGQHGDVFRVSAIDLLNEFSKLCIIGGPGSGKSTFARFVVASLGNQHLPDRSRDANEGFLKFFSASRDLIPLFIETREFFGKDGVADPAQEVTQDHIWEYLVSRFNVADHQSLMTALSSKRGLVVLDGLDEIPLPNGVEDVAKRMKQVERLRGHAQLLFSDARFLVTCRASASSHWTLDGFETVELDEFSQEDTSRLLKKIAEAQLGQTVDSADLERLGEQLLKIPDRLKDYPLFLTMLSAVFWSSEERSLPGNLSVLFEKTIRILLGKWSGPENSGRQSLLEEAGCSMEELIPRLEKLALRTHIEHGSLGSDESGIELRDLLESLFGLGISDQEHFVSRLAHHSGVIWQKAEAEFAFAHNGFKEFLAAAAIYRDAKIRYQEGSDDPFGLLVESVQYRNLLHWREVIRLLAELTFFGERRRDIWDLLEVLTSNFGRSRNEFGRTAKALAVEIYLDNRIADVKAQTAPTIEKKLVDLCRRTLLGGQFACPEKIKAARLLDTLARRNDGAGLDRSGLPKLVFCKIPEGIHTIGLSKAQRDFVNTTPWGRGWTFDRETPEFQVETAGFEISKFPVTEIQFSSFYSSQDGYFRPEFWCVNGRDWLESTTGSKRVLSDTSLPAANVNWYEAQAFCAWLSEKTGLRLRLPTEIEWEISARPDGSIFSWGNEFLADRTNFEGTLIGERLPVGCFQGYDTKDFPQDMNGNVWEWCSTTHVSEDGDQFDYPSDPLDSREEANPEPKDEKIVRGGSYLNPPFLVRSSYRGRDSVRSQALRKGFRVVKEIKN